MTEHVALVYDFDGTLSPGNMQDQTLLPELGHTSPMKSFWPDVRRLAEERDADEILIYMDRLLALAHGCGKPLTTTSLREHGAQLRLFEGLDTWFDRMTRYGAERDLIVHHYVVSSGLKEMIAACSIARHFRHVFASSYQYEDERAVSAAVAINYTTKTQYLFRINKGILNSWDRKALNTYMAPRDRPIQFSRMIFLGDGDTDIPAMKMVRLQGGEAIAVFGNWEDAKHREVVSRLIEEDRVKMVAAADYRENSQLEVLVKGLLARMARDAGWRPKTEAPR